MQSLHLQWWVDKMIVKILTQTYHIDHGLLAANQQLEIDKETALRWQAYGIAEEVKKPAEKPKKK